jgi:receptor expression-enhancing protein 1/2/3/4
VSRLVLGTLYPAYRSYKAIKNKDVREHVKWMMYWIVFALFTTMETFLDVFLSWFPFYYEIKIVFILWVLSPATRGSSLLYKKLVHPMLTSKEKEIDDLIEKTKQQGYTTFLQLFVSGYQYASTLFVHSALKGQVIIGSQLKKSLSMNDVYDDNSNQLSKRKEIDAIDEDAENSSDIEDVTNDYMKSQQTRKRGSLKNQTSTTTSRSGSNGRINSNNGYDMINHDSNDDYSDDGHIQTRRASSRSRPTTKISTSSSSSRYPPINPLTTNSYKSYEVNIYNKKQQ